MNWLQKRNVQGDAVRDADLAINSIDDHIVRRLGPRPVFDPVGNHEHGRVAAALNRGTEVAEWRDDLQGHEREQNRHMGPWLLLLAIIGCFFIEFLGAILIMNAVGVSEGERVPLAAALALALIGMTALTSGRAASGPQSASATERAS